MCQVNNFNVDHERNVKACNCCKNKESAAAVSATLVERERIINLAEELEAKNPTLSAWSFVHNLKLYIKGENK